MSPQFQLALKSRDVSSPVPRRIIVGWIGVALVLAVVSLSINTGVANDPRGWIVWTRELVGPGAAVLTGPTWHPLQILLLAPFTAITRSYADVWFWLFISRFVGLLGIGAIALIAVEMAGWWAGALAAVLALLSPIFVSGITIGLAEPLVGCLGAFGYLAFHRGRYRLAGLLMLMAALARPEAWLLALAYGCWMARKRLLRYWQLVVLIVLTGALWEYPFLRRPASGLTSSNGSGEVYDAIHAVFPFGAAVIDAVNMVTVVQLALCAAALLASLLVWRASRTAAGTVDHRRGGRWTQCCAALQLQSTGEYVVLGAGTVWVVTVAAMTQAGFPGNPRYLDPAAMAFELIAAVTAVRAARLVMLPVVIIAAAVTALTLLQTGPQIRDAFGAARRLQQVTDKVRYELPYLHCPRYVWARKADGNTVALLSGQTLPESKEPAQGTLQSEHIHAIHYHYGWIARCAPPHWGATGRNTQ